MTNDIEILKLSKAAESEGGIYSVAWSPDGKFLVTMGFRFPLLVWRASSLAIEHQLEHEHPVGDSTRTGAAIPTGNTVAFTPDGRFLLSVWYRNVGMWRCDDWKWVRDFDAARAGINLSATIGIRSILVDTNPDQLLVVYRSVPPEESHVVAYALEGGRMLWKMAPPQVLAFPVIDTPIVRAGEDLILATGESSSDPREDKKRFTRMLFLDRKTGTPRRSWDNVLSDTPTALAVSQAKGLVAAATSTGVVERTANVATGSIAEFRNSDPIRIWKAGSADVVQSLPVKSRVWALAFSPDGRFLVSSQSDRQEHLTISVWDVSSGRAIQVIAPPAAIDTPSEISFSPDGKSVAVVGNRGIAVYEFRPH